MRARPFALPALAALGLAGACDCGGEPIVATQPSAQVPALLDFGPIGEGTTVTRPIVVENVGQAELEVSAVIGAGSSADTGSYTMTFTGDPFQCSCFDGALGSPPCEDQTFNVTATR